MADDFALSESSVDVEVLASADNALLVETAANGRKITADENEALPSADLPMLSQGRLCAMNLFNFSLQSVNACLAVMFLSDRARLMVDEAVVGTAVGVVSGLSGAASGVANPLFGSLSDHFGSRFGRRTPFIVMGSVMTFALMFPFALSGYFLVWWSFAVSFIAINAAMTCATAPFSAIIPDCVCPAQYGAASGYMGLMTMLGNAFGAGVMGLIAAPLASRFGNYFIPECVILGAAVVLGTIVTVFSVKEKPCVARPRARGAETSFWRRQWAFIKSIAGDIAAPFRSRDFCWVFLTRFLMSTGINMVVNFLQLYFDDVVKDFSVFGLFSVPDGKAATSLFLLPLLLGAVVASLVAGILSDRYGRKLLVYIAGGLQAAAALCMILFPSMSFAVVLGFVFGLGYGAFQSVDFALAADVLPDKETAGKDLGVWHLAVICASSVGPLVAGLLLDAFKAVGMTAFGSPRLGYIVIFSVAVCLFILSTVLVSRMSVGGRPTPQTVDQAETIDFENTNDTEDVVADTDDDIAMEEKKQV